MYICLGYVSLVKTTGYIPLFFRSRVYMYVVCMYVIVYVCMYMCVCVYVYMCVCVYVYVCMCVCVCVCLCVFAITATPFNLELSILLGISKNGFLKFLKNWFLAELLSFFYICLKFLCKFEEQLLKTQRR